jgi:hypothetical protein
MRFMAVLSSCDGVWDAAAERDVRVDAGVDGVSGEGAADAVFLLDGAALDVRVLR